MTSCYVVSQQSLTSLPITFTVKDAFTDIKLYLFFFLGVVGNVPNGGISNVRILML